MRVKINRAGKFGTILARFGTKTFSGIYMRVEINRAGKFGTILARFGTKTFSDIYMRVEINRANKFWTILARFGTKPNFSQLPLVALLCSALELQNIEFLK